MNTRNILGGAVGLLALSLLVGMALHSQRTLERGLPPRLPPFATQVEALAAATQYAAGIGGQVAPVIGTGSMAPYIPPAHAGCDPRKTVVAYAVTDPRERYENIAPGKLVIYRAAWDASVCVMHGAAQKDRGGWIMSGLHNERSEASWRVTPSNFIGLVAAVYVWGEKP